MNNAIITVRRDGRLTNAYAFFDRYIDRYKTFAVVKNDSSMSPRLTRKEMNYMLIRSTIYKIPAKPIHL